MVVYNKGSLRVVVVLRKSRDFSVGSIEMNGEEAFLELNG